MPKAESQRTALAQQIGADGLHLLQALEEPDAPERLKNEACVQQLRQVWRQYYDLAGGKAKWRAGPQEISDEGVIRSPYDPEARTGKKREIVWLGYKAHLTETCALETNEQKQANPLPQLITNVQTTLANVQDVEVTTTMQEDLAQHALLPEEQIVDTGYRCATPGEQPPASWDRVGGSSTLGQQLAGQSDESRHRGDPFSRGTKNGPTTYPL